MPQTSRNSQTRPGELPGTLQRSSEQVQEAFAEALDEAVSVYGAGDEAQRAAYATLKQRFEKRGDHWIAKEPQSPGRLWRRRP